MIIRISHVRGVTGLRKSGGLCTSSVRLWCQQHGVDLRAFVRDGMDEERVLAIGGAFGARVVAYAHAQAEASHG